MRSNMSIGGAGSLALPGPNISPRAQASSCSRSKEEGRVIGMARGKAGESSGWRVIVSVRCRRVDVERDSRSLHAAAARQRETGAKAWRARGPPLYCAAPGG
ncbi:hypothetical protein PAGU2638_18770 [Lysobacter sp. PAGU 2638]